MLTQCQSFKVNRLIIQRVSALSAKFNMSAPREIILNSVINRFDLEVERKKTLEEKANNLGGFVGVMLSLISGFGLTYISAPKFEGWTWTYLLQTTTLVFFALVYVTLFVSLALALKAIQIKKYTYVPDAFNLSGLYENSSSDIVCLALYDEYAIAIKTNTSENNAKAVCVKHSMYGLLAAFVFLAIHVTLFISVGR